MAPLTLVHPRDLSAWRKDGIQFSTTSNEAACLYDVLMYQTLASTEDMRYDGIEGTSEKLQAADSDFVLLKVLKFMDQFFCCQWHKRKDVVKAASSYVRQTLGSANVTDLERRHLKALELFVTGQHKEACGVWQDTLNIYPKDLLAMRQAFEYGICYGDAPRMRSAMVTCQPHYQMHDPYYPFMLSRLAFSVEESGDFTTARIMAKKALEVNPKDPWGTHAMAHVFDASGEGSEGATFMQSTVTEWQDASLFACHNFWHMALMHVDTGDFDSAFAVYDNEILPRLTRSKQAFPLSDATSLLFRLQLEGKSVPRERWRELAEVGYVNRVSKRRFFGYYDSIFALCFANVACDSFDSRISSLYKELYDEVTEYTSSKEVKKEDLVSVHKDVGLNVISASQKYVNGDFSGAASILYPNRFDIYRLGGSQAQRDVFHQMLCRSLLKSDEELDLHRCRGVLEERQLMRPKCGVTKRLLLDLAHRQHAHC